MSDGSIEVLLLFSYLAIALVAVTIAVYAISVTYLGRETSLSIWRVRKKTEDLKKRLREKNDKLQNAEMKEIKSSYLQEIEVGEKEVKDLQGRINWLKLRRAVLFPSLFFIIAFMLSSFGILIGSTFEVVLFLSGLSMFTGFYCLLRTLLSIESAALRVPLPKIRVFFRSRSSVLAIEPRKRQAVEFIFNNEGEEIAENLEIYLNFPNDFKLKGGAGYNVVPQGELTDYVGHTAAVFQIERLHVDVYTYRLVKFVSPSKAGSYEVPVSVREKRSGRSEVRLTIKVAK
jgi:hypothetical protein